MPCVDLTSAYPAPCVGCAAGSERSARHSRLSKALFRICRSIRSRPLGRSRSIAGKDKRWLDFDRGCRCGSSTLFRHRWVFAQCGTRPTQGPMVNTIWGLTEAPALNTLGPATRSVGHATPTNQHNPHRRRARHRRHSWRLACRSLRARQQRRSISSVDRTFS